MQPVAAVTERIKELAIGVNEAVCALAVQFLLTFSQGLGAVCLKVARSQCCERSSAGPRGTVVDGRRPVTEIREAVSSCFVVG